MRPNVIKSIDGWAKVRKEVERNPVPEEVLLWAGSWLLEHNFQDAAECLCLQLDCYLRPSEAVSLKKNQIFPPQPTAGPQYRSRWSLCLAPQELGVTTKTGHFDDTLTIGTPNRLWVKDVVAALFRRTDTGQRFWPDLTLARYEQAFKHGCAALKITNLNLTPHVVRHTGPSADRLFNRMSLDQCQKRGRWASPKSVNRYEKHARIMKQLQKLQPSQQASMAKAAHHFPAELLKTFETGA